MPKILIIEDDEDFREGLSFSLQSEGYETMEAATAREAFERLDANPCSMVLLDCNLPDASGRENGEYVIHNGYRKNTACPF